MPANFDLLKTQEKKTVVTSKPQEVMPEEVTAASSEVKPTFEDASKNIADVAIARQKLDEVNAAIAQSDYNSEISEGTNLANYWLSKAKLDSLEEDFTNNDYKMDLDPGVWDAISGIISSTADKEGPEAAEELSYKYASAIQLSKMLGLTMEDAMASLDDTVHTYYGDEYKDYKTKYKAIKDSFTLGVNTLRETKLGAKLQELEAAGDEEGAKQIWDIINKLDEYSNSLQDTMPRKWTTEAMKNAMQTLPYTAAVAAPSILAGIVAPGLGTLAGFAAGFDVTYGTEYIELRRAGVDPKIAQGVAALSSAGQAAVEQMLGTIANTSSKAAASIGQRALKDTILDKGLDKAAAEISTALFKRFHFGELGYKAIARGLMEYGENALEEGAEEALQSFISAGGKYLAQYCSENDIDVPDIQEIWQQACEEAKGAILGSLILGIPDAGFSAKATINDFNAVKTEAIKSDSREDFIKTMQKSQGENTTAPGAAVFNGMSEEKIKEAAGKIYDANTKERSLREETLTKEYAEQFTAEEGTETLAVDEETGEKEEAGKEYRTQEGALYTQDEIKEVDEDGNQHGTFQAGNKETGKNYGYIKYTINNDKGTVTIDSYKMVEHRNNLRKELFEDFADQYSDYDIVWNPTEEGTKALKQTLIDANPRGKEAGLNYFTQAEDKDTVKTRVEVARQIRDNFNFKKDREVYTAVAVFEAFAAGQNQSLKEFFYNTFSGQIFGDRQVLQEAAKRQNAVDQNGNVIAQGGINIYSDIESSVKAVIYTSNKSDLSTWLHELTHLWRKMLTGEQLEKLNAAMGIKDGVWTNDLDEKLAELAETAYGRGLIENQDLKGLLSSIEDILQNLAEFIMRVIGILKQRGDINPELLEQFNTMLKGDDNLMAKAAKAVKEADNEKKQTEKQTKEEKTQDKTAETKKDLQEKKETMVRSDESTELAEAVQTAEGVIKDDAASIEEKAQAVLTESKTLKQIGEEQTIDDSIDLFQLMGRSVISQDPKLTQSFLQFIKMKKEGVYTNADIKKATGWEQDPNGNIWHEEDNLHFRSEQVKQDIEGLLKDGEKYKNAIITLKPLSEIISENEAMLYPGMKDSVLYLMNLEGNQLDAVYVPGSNAIVINTTRVKDGWTFMRSLTNGIQQAILKNEGMLDVDTTILQNLITQNARAVTQLKKAGQQIDRAIMQEIKNLFTEYLASPVGRLSYEVSQRYAKNEKPTTLFFNPQQQAMQFQIMGEKGAANLDTAEEVTTRLDNLKIAREMEKEGKDAKTIRLATSWEKGKDGLWRYETDDNVEIESEFRPNAKIKEKYPKYKEFLDRIHKDRFAIRKFTQEEREEYLKYQNEANEIERAYIDYDNVGNKKWINAANLDDVIYAPELFTAYPELRNVKFIIQKFDGGTLGSYSFRENTIKIDNENVRKDTLLHEIQHAIQYIEGFAGGGNTEAFTEKVEVSPLKKALSSFSGYSKEDLINHIGEAGIQEMKDIGLTDEQIKEVNPDIDNLGNIYEILNRVYKDYGLDYLYNEIQEAAEDVKNEGKYKADGKYFDTPFEAYSSIAGEVEARNVQNRYSMTAEERLNTLLAETEDVAREDQIILANGLVSLSAKKEQFRNTDNSTVMTFEEAKKLYPNIVDLSEVFNNPAPDAEVVRKYLNGLYKNGPYATLTPDKKIQFYKSEGKSKHIYTGDNYKTDNKRIKKARARISLKIEELVNNAVYKESSLPDENHKKPKLSGYQYFTVPIYINGHGYEVLLQAEVPNDNKKASNFSYGNKPAKNTYTGSQEDSNILLAKLQAKKVSYLYNFRQESFLFQTAYHGTSADFDRFNTDFIDSGEGSQAFGYGLYFTQSEDIAKDYAERQYTLKYDPSDLKNQLEAKKQELARIIKDRKLYESKETYEKAYKDKVENYKNEIELYKAAGKSTTWKENLLKRIIAKGATEEDRLENLTNLQNQYDEITSNIDRLEDQIATIEAKPKGKRNLYTVDIPGSKLIQWDKKVRESTKNKVVSELEKELLNDEDSGYNESNLKDLKEDLRTAFSSELDGEDLYNTIISYLGSDKNASLFLRNIGYKGIEYSAGTNFGYEGDARNYVIFSDKDVSITEHIQFQTELDLINDAQTFETWQEFMEYCETFGGDAIPSGADATWYENTWARAHQIQSTEEVLTQERNEAIAGDQEEDADSTDPVAVDALFLTALRSRAGMLEDFLQKIEEIKDEEYIEAQDAAEESQNEKLRQLKDYISKFVKHATVKSYAKGVYNGKQLDQIAVNKIVKTMSNSVRAYRALYADVMQDNAWKVREADSIEAQIKKNSEELKKLKGLESDINIDVLSAEERTKIAKKLENEVLREQVKSGKILAAADYDGLIKSYEQEIKNKEKEIEKAAQDYQETLNDITDYQQRDIIRLYEKLLKAQAEYNKKSTTPARHAESAIKTGERYRSGIYSDETGTYNGIYRRYTDAVKLAKVTEEVKYAQKLLEKQAELKADVRDKKAQKQEIENLKNLRKRLVKRSMRRVDFKNIDYDHARIIIAIQRLFEPNLEGGVNKWIGTEGKYARQVWSEYYTDEKARDKIRRELDYNGSKTAKDLLMLLENTKSEADFSAWTNKQRQAIYRMLPKEDWVKELRLVELDKEREESIQLPLTSRTYRKEISIGDGKTKTVELTRLEPSEELAQEIRAVIGDEMYTDLVIKDFAEWTTHDMEKFARAIDDYYVEGKQLLNAKKKARKQVAQELRDQILEQVLNTGIVINPDDPPEVKERKQKKIDKLLGYTDQIKGTAADSYKRKNFFNKILHGYFDANVRRVARILDNQSESINTNLLYWAENNAYINEDNNKSRRIAKINSALEKAGLTVADLYKKVEIADFDNNGTTITLSVDELLYYYQAQFDEKSRDAVAYGCMIDVKDRQKYKDADDAYIQAIEQAGEDAINALITGDENARDEAITAKIDLLKVSGIKEQKEQLKKEHPEWTEARLAKEVHLRPTGSEAYKADCNDRYNKILKAANELLATNPGLKDFKDAIAEDYASEFDRLNKTSVDVFNSPVARVENYVPLVRLSLAGDTNEQRVKADLLAQTAEAGGNVAVNKGMTQKRVNIGALNQMPVEAGLYKTWAEQVERTEHFIAYSDYVRLLRDVYGSRDATATMQWIESRYGNGMKTYIKDYINEVANPEAGKMRSSIDSFVRAMRGRTAPAYLSWKMSSILKQAVTSPMPYMQFISPVEYISAAFKYMAHPIATEEAIKAKSNFMKNRKFDPIADVINEEMNKQNNPKFITLWNRFSQTGMQGLEFIDWACVAPGWQAIYEKEYKRLSKEASDKYDSQLAAAKENTPLWNAKSEEELDLIAKEGVMSEEEIEQAAINTADDAVRLSQPSNRITDISPLFKTKGTGNEIVKALLQFTMSLNVIWQNIRYDLPYAVKNKQYKQTIGMIAGYTLAGIGLQMLAGNIPTGGDDDDEKVKELIYGATTQFTDAIPIIGSSISAMDEKLITGKAQFTSGADLFPTLTKFIQGTTAAGSGDWEKACKRYGEGVAMSIGAPVSGIKEILAAFGLDDDEEGAEFKPETFLGQR